MPLSHEFLVVDRSAAADKFRPAAGTYDSRLSNLFHRDPERDHNGMNMHADQCSADINARGRGLSKVFHSHGIPESLPGRCPEGSPRPDRRDAESGALCGNGHSRGGYRCENDKAAKRR